MASARPIFARHTATWKVVREYIQEQIAVGRYPVGSWLPSVRQLALELGINRNTIAKAYHTLGESGLVELVHGNGVRVVATHSTSPASGADLVERLEAIVHDARRRGLPRDWVIGRVTAALERTYAAELEGVGFVECTERDSRTLANDMSQHLGITIHPLVLADLPSAGRELARFRLLATTVFHLREVTDIVRGRTRVVGVDFVLSHESAIAIARIPRQARVAVVAPNEHTLERVSRVVESLTHGEPLACTVHDDAEFRAAIARADVIVDVALTHEAVARLLPNASTITVDFHAEAPSMALVREALLDRRTRAGRVRQN